MLLQKLTVDQSFQKFLTNLNPTDKQRQQIQTTRETIDSVLANDKRISLHTQKQPSFLTGSYSRGTIIRPIHDVDLYVRVHYGEHAKEKSPRSILLLIASALRNRYPNNTKVNVNSPCVVVSFFGYIFEVAPVVCYEDNPELYDIPAPGSQSWMQCYPNVPSRWLSSCNHKNNQMFIPLIKILKHWNRNNKVGFKSFHLELLTEKVFSSVTDIQSYPQGIFDWMYCIRAWLWENDHPFIEEPGQRYKYVDNYVYENAFQLRVIRKKLDVALKRAERAYDFYLKGKHISARTIWQNMFGSMFPSPEPLPSKPILTPPKQPATLTVRDTFSLSQTATGLISGIHRNALLDALSNPQPKISDIFGSDITRKTLIDLLANSNDPFK